MKETHTLVVGASIAGLSTAAALKKNRIDHVVIEKHSQVASPWRNHYDRLHLHTNKRVSNLPFKKFDSNIPRYPSRQQVIDYLENYQRSFAIAPLFNTEARSIRKNGDYWTTETDKGSITSKYLVIATGSYSSPRKISIDGMNSFPGRILHSSGYRTGKDFTGQKVLVIGFGNSACEIAIDLFEQGAQPVMSVRSPVNVIPREIAGIPILEISQLMSRLPPRVADTLNAPILKLLFGDIRKLGLRRMSYGPFEQISKDRNIPLLDIGTISHIRKGHIGVRGAIDHIDGSHVFFTGGQAEKFDAIVAAIGYDRSVAGFLEAGKERLEDLRFPVSKQKLFGKDGLYFCGFWVSPTGQIKEIGKDACLIAGDIAKKEKLATASR